MMAGEHECLTIIIFSNDGNMLCSCMRNVEYSKQEGKDMYMLSSYFQKLLFSKVFSTCKKNHKRKRVLIWKDLNLIYTPSTPLENKHY